MRQFCSSWFIAPKNDRFNKFNPSLESNTGSCKLKLSNLKLVRLFVPSLAIFRMKSCSRLYWFSHQLFCCASVVFTDQPYVTSNFAYLYLQSWSVIFISVPGVKSSLQVFSVRIVDVGPVADPCPPGNCFCVIYLRQEAPWYQNVLFLIRLDKRHNFLMLLKSYVPSHNAILSLPLNSVYLYLESSGAMRWRKVWSLMSW